MGHCVITAKFSEKLEILVANASNPIVRDAVKIKHTSELAVILVAKHGLVRWVR